MFDQKHLFLPSQNINTHVTDHPPKNHFNHTQPQIFREIHVESFTTFFELHRIIQLVMGWQNYHMFEFMVHEYRIGIPDKMMDAELNQKTIDSKTVTLASTLTEPKEKFQCLYDFGDDWEHTIEVKKFLPKNPSIPYPICIGGGLACPTEDSGGIHGFYENLEILGDDRHPEYMETKRWKGL